MKVFVALCDYGYEGARVLAICSTQEQARNRAMKKHLCAAEDHAIEEWEVDGPNDSGTTLG